MCESYCNALPWITGRCKVNVCIGSGFEPESQKVFFAHISACRSSPTRSILEDVYGRITTLPWLDRKSVV